MQYTAMVGTPTAQHLTQKPHGIQFGTFVMVALIIFGVCWLWGKLK